MPLVNIDSELPDNQAIVGLRVQTGRNEMGFSVDYPGRLADQSVVMHQCQQLASVISALGDQQCEPPVSNSSSSRRTSQRSGFMLI